MTKTFRDAFIEHLAALKARGVDISLKKIAEGSGVSYEQLRKINQRALATTNVDDAVKIARFFGATIEEFLEDETALKRIELIDLYNQLEPPEQSFLIASARGLRGARDQNK